MQLASLRLTLWLFALLLLCVVSYYAGLRHPWVIVVPLLLLSINLLAAITTHPTFRRQLPLLSFHLALLTLLLLLVTSRLSHLDGQMEVTAGESFDGQLTAYDAGPLHRWHLGQVPFRLDDFSVAYAAGPSRDVTRATVSWRDARDRAERGVIGDHHPLVLQGYRFYTTANKGFAPVFIWQPDEGGTAQRGSIHLPAYPAHEHRQALEWMVPGTELALWTQLQFDETIIAPDASSMFRAPREHLLVMRHGDKRQALRLGESLSLPGGTLTYQELRTWMGFRVTSDWTLPWLFTAGLVAALSLAAHYWVRFMATPWDGASVTADIDAH